MHSRLTHVKLAMMHRWIHLKHRQRTHLMSDRIYCCTFQGYCVIMKEITSFFIVQVVEFSWTLQCDAGMVAIDWLMVLSWRSIRLRNCSRRRRTRFWSSTVQPISQLCKRAIFLVGDYVIELVPEIFGRLVLRVVRCCMRSDTDCIAKHETLFENWRKVGQIVG